MLNVRRAHPSLVIATLACFAMAFASAVWANEDAKSADQNKQKQESAQQKASQQNTSKQNSTEQTNQTSRQQNTQNQQNARNEKQQQADQTEQARQSSDQNQRSAQQNERQQNEDQQNRRANAQNGAGEWPAPQRYESQRNSSQAAGNERGQRQGRGGASLGVSIVRSDEGNGVTVMRIVPNTAAERMGLQRRDRITKINGEPVRSVDDFISEIQNMSPGDSVELQVTRNGNQRTIRGELAGYSESVVETQGPSGTRGYRQFRSYIEPNRSNSRNGRNEREEYAPDSRENMQTSYNDRGESSGRMQSGELESRISRIEQQLDRLTEQVNRLNNQDQSQSAQRNVPSDSGTR